MGVIGLIVLAVLGVMGAALSRLLADELKAWSPWLVERLVRVAARRVPARYRARLSEEWRGHLDEVPGELSKILVACGCLWASLHLRSGNSILQRIMAAVFLLIEIPVVTFIILVLKIETPSRPAIVRRRFRWERGQYRCFAFSDDGMFGRFIWRIEIGRLPILLDIALGRVSFGVGDLLRRD